MYIRVGVGGGSGYEIHITTDDTNLYGYTITISKNGTTVGTTVFDNTGNASFSVDETGTYTVSVTYDGNTYSENVVVSAFEVELSAGFVLSSWLIAGGISGTYASLSDVLADEDAVRQLMTIHAAVDYLASFDSTDASVVTILNDNYAAKWISLTDYAMDVLEAAYGTLMGTIGKYGYGEWGITDATITPPTWGALGNVPVMTSNTAPYGTASAYQVFDGNPSTTASGTDFSYTFTNPVCVKDFVVKDASGNAVTGGTLQACNDGSTWGTPTDGEYYLGWRVHFAASQTVGTVQFYGRTLKVSVPKMSGNTTPYGEVIYTTTNSGASYRPFDKTNNGRDQFSTYGNTRRTVTGEPKYVGYSFVSPVRVKMVMLRTIYDNQETSHSDPVSIQYSDDATTWETDTSFTIGNENKTHFVTITEDEPHRYWRAYMTGANLIANPSGGWMLAIDELDFFGVDYTEREWDTEHPRRYLYDHGVEVETLDGSSFTVDTTYSITGNVKNPSDLELHSPSGNYSSSFGTNAMIDNSGGDYSLLFVNINQARLGTTPLIMSVATTKAAYTNNRLGLLNPSVPYSGSLQALDVSNMLQSFYCVLDAPSNRWANVNEWWLE